MIDIDKLLKEMHEADIRTHYIRLSNSDLYRETMKGKTIEEALNINKRWRLKVDDL